MPNIQKSEEVQGEASAIDSLSDLSIQPRISVSRDPEFPSTKWAQDLGFADSDWKDLKLLHRGIRSHLYSRSS